jgi:SpoIID/LytB domain protein
MKRAAQLIVVAIIGTFGFRAEGSAGVQRGRSDAGILRVGMLRSGGGYAIESVSVEAYVARVLAGEAARDSPPAALEALAITIRTFAIANRGRHRADGFDLCDQTHCQVVRDATPATDRAATATVGRILLSNGRPASIYYTASCGGRSEIPSAVWPGAYDPPFLPSKVDDGCQGAPAWSAVLDDADLLRALRAAGYRGDRLIDMRISGRTGSSRVAYLDLAGLQPRSISGQDLRVAVGRTIGWQHIKSTAFEVSRVEGGYRFSGHGSGHGVGLCVVGSARLAARGKSVDEILKQYFPGLEVAGGPETVTRTTIRASPVLTAAPDNEAGGHAAIEREALRARDELARSLGVAPPNVTLRFHESPDDFERVTGRSWFSGGAAVNGELHLAPLAALHDRGLLDVAIRRGVVHLIVDGPLADRPAWVREGAALFYTNPSGGSPLSGHVACPTDAELERPVSAGALSNAYARARACFARQIEAGRTWKDVR